MFQLACCIEFKVRNKTTMYLGLYEVTTYQIHDDSVSIKDKQPDVTVGGWVNQQ